MRVLPCLASTLLMSVAASAAPAATTVIGSGFAHMCFEAADAQQGSEAALDFCNQAFDEPLSPKDRVATYVNRGIIRFHLNDFAGAMADYDRAIALDSDEPEAYINKGSVMLKRGDWRHARDLFDLAIQHRTRRPEIAYFGRAVANEIGGDLTDAYRDYQHASELAPGWDQPKRELARFSVRKPSEQ